MQPISLDAAATAEDLEGDNQLPETAAAATVGGKVQLDNGASMPPERPGALQGRYSPDRRRFDRSSLGIGGGRLEVGDGGKQIGRAHV